MPELVFYDRKGRAVAYTEDGEHIFNFGGAPVAYLDGDSVYSFSGTHLGWCADGWIRDYDGACVYFTEGAVGGPIRPITRVNPIKSIQRILPIKAVQRIKPVRHIDKLTWSPNSIFNR